MAQDEATHLGIMSIVSEDLARAPMTPYLYVTQPRNSRVKIRLSTRPLTLGRSRDADLVLHDRRISRVHCKIQMIEQAIIVEDLSSTNGTFINGRAIDQAVLSPLDQLQLGNYVLRVEYRNPEAVAQELEVYRAATTDALTGVPNRRYLEEQGEACLAQCEIGDEPISIIILDIDHFKAVNDGHGHGAGDKLLTLIGSTIYREKRRHDVVGRFGGEEFVLILPNTAAGAALQYCERLGQRIADLRCPWKDCVLAATVSIGCHTVTSVADHTFQDLLEKADAALYVAKRGGRNRVEQTTDEK